MHDPKTIRDVLAHLAAQADSDRELMIAAHDFVRDSIRFGFTARFDDVTPQMTLERRLGHCNPQADLLRAMLAEAGFEARLKFVGLDKRLLRGATAEPVYRLLPAHVSHALLEVRGEGGWIELDSYIFPPDMLRRRRARLAQAGLPCGFGTFEGASPVWDGDSPAYSQAAPAYVLPDSCAVYRSLAEFVREGGGDNRLLGVPFWRWMWPLRMWPASRLVEGVLNASRA